MTEATVADDLLRSYFDRWQRLEEDKKAISDDLKELFAEAKGNGFDTKVMRAVFREEVSDKAERDEFEAICDLYRASLARPRARPTHARVEKIDEFRSVTGRSDPATTKGESDAKSADAESEKRNLIDRRRPALVEAIEPVKPSAAKGLEHQPVQSTYSDTAPDESAADEISSPIPLASADTSPVAMAKAPSLALPRDGAPLHEAMV